MPYWQYFSHVSAGFGKYNYFGIKNFNTRRLSYDYNTSDHLPIYKFHVVTKVSCLI